MITKKDVYRIGKIGKPHGIKGEVVMYFDDDVFDHTECPYLFIETEGLLVPFFIEEYRFRSDTTVLMLFEDIDSQEKARRLTGCEVFFSIEEAPQEAQALSQAQLIGYTVYNHNTQQEVGTVSYIDNSTINLLFEIHTADDQYIWIPVAEELIHEIDTNERKISLDIADGILDLK